MHEDVANVMVGSWRQEEAPVMVLHDDPVGGAGAHERRSWGEVEEAMAAAEDEPLGCVVERRV